MIYKSYHTTNPPRTRIPYLVKKCCKNCRFDTFKDPKLVVRAIDQNKSHHPATAPRKNSVGRLLKNLKSEETCVLIVDALLQQSMFKGFDFT